MKPYERENETQGKTNMIYQGPKQNGNESFYAGKNDCLLDKPFNPPKDDEYEANEYRIGWASGEHVKSVLYICNGSLD